MEKYIKKYIGRIRTANTDEELKVIISDIYDEGYGAGGNYDD